MDRLASLDYCIDRRCVLFISKIDLDPNRAAYLKRLSSPYRLHAAIEASLPAAERHETDQGRVLWRLDGLPGGRGVRLYIVSPDEPDLTSIARQAGDEVSSGETKSYDRFLKRIAEGQRYRFRLKANPVRKVFKDQGRVPNSRVVGTLQGHITEEHRLRWLLDRTEKHGFRLLEGDFGPEVRIAGSSREIFMRGNARVTLATALYEGVLEVTDGKAFRHALTFGIGRAKGFGCGLMTVVPLAQGASRERVD